MNDHAKQAQAGFTLIEILVALILISLLVAAVFPVVTQQTGQADAPRLGNDLANIRSGIELFNVNVQALPADLEDLTSAIAGTEQNITGVVYTGPEQTRWDGPYIDAALAAGTLIQETGDAISSGFDAVIQNDLVGYNVGTNAVVAFPVAAADFVAIRIAPLSTADFAALNDLVDGSADTTNNNGLDEGKLRKPTAANATTDPAYYLAVPF